MWCVARKSSAILEVMITFLVAFPCPRCRAIPRVPEHPDVRSGPEELPELRRTIEDMKAQILALQQARREDRTLLYSVLSALPTPTPEETDTRVSDQLTFDDLLLKMTAASTRDPEGWQAQRGHKKEHRLGSRTVRALERERQSLDQLEAQLGELKRDLTEMVRVKEGQLGLRSEVADVRLDMEGLRGTLKNVQQGFEAMRSTRDDEATLRNQMRVQQTTTKWLQKSVEQVRAEMGEIAASLNVSLALRQRQQFESSVQLLRSDFASLRRDMELVRAMVEKDKAAVGQVQQDVQDVRKTCQQLALGQQHLVQELSSVRDDLNSVRLRASSLAAITSTPHEQAKSEESATSRFEETNNQLVDDIISSGDGDQADLLGGIIGRMPPGNHQQKGGVAHRHFRHEGGRLKYDVEVAKAAIRGLEHIQARLEKDAAQVRHNLSVVYGDILHVESVTTRLSNRTGTLETHVALADHQMSAVRDQLRELATKSERQAADIRNMSEAVSSVDKLHTSTVQLFEALEALEEKLGKSVADLQKDVSRFDFNMAQMQSTMDILREDQSSNLATLKTIKKEQALARLEMQKDHYQLMAVRNEVLNWSLQECRHNNADALHALKVANMNAQLNKLATRVDGQAREIEALHGRVRTKADNSAIQGLENKTKALDERLENVSLDVPLLEGRVNNVHKQLAKFVRTLPADCSRLSQGLSSPSMSYKSGVHLIHPGDLDSAVEVYCDMETDGGEWTVIQRRQDGTEDFYRDWDEYAEGFGRLDGEYWLGNRAIHELTKRANYTLRLDMWDTAGHYKYAQYTHFVVASEDDDFRLSLGGYNGNASDAMYYHNQMAFSTRDRDNDASSTHCATYYSSGWWYNHCQYVNINGRYNIGLTWYDIDEHEWVQLTRVEMKVRPAKETSVHEPT